jgi:hypothetical protein
MKKSQNKKGAEKRRGGPSRGATADQRVARDENPRDLPPVQDQLAVGVTLRFIATALFTGQMLVRWQDLLDAWFIAGTATNCYQLFDFVRVKRVVIRSMGGARALAPGVAGSAPCSTVGIEFFDVNVGTTGGGKQKSNTSLGYDVPAFLALRPDPKSSLALFQASNGNNAFAIRAVDQDNNALAGTVVDVDLVYRNSADVNPAAVSSARAGLSPGNLYFGGLDGLPSATTQMRSAFVLRA